MVVKYENGSENTDFWEYRESFSGDTQTQISSPNNSEDSNQSPSVKQR